MNNAPNEAKFSHELIAGAASYEVWPNGFFFSFEFNHETFRLPKPMRTTAQKMVNPRPTPKQKSFCQCEFECFPALKTYHRDLRLSTRAGFSGGVVDRIAETKGVRLLSIERILSHLHHLHFSLTLSTERKPSTKVNISIPTFFLPQISSNGTFSEPTTLQRICGWLWWG